MAVENFCVQQVVYKQIYDQFPVFADIMIPKSITSGKVPVNLRFHGGHLICGSRDSIELTPPRILQHAYDNGLIIVTSDYRLLPESGDVQAILDDIEDLWEWVSSHSGSSHNKGLTDLVKDMTQGQVEPDLKRIIATGESAGGYLALQLAILHPTNLLGVVATYPMVDMEDPFWSMERDRITSSQLEEANGLIDEHLKVLPSGPCPSSRPIDSAAESLRDAILHSGRYSEFFGSQPHFFPLRRLENNPTIAMRFPFLWIQHGASDSEVPISGSRKLVQTLRRFNPNICLRYTEIPNGDHGVSTEILLMSSGQWQSGTEVLNGYLFPKE